MRKKKRLKIVIGIIILIPCCFVIRSFLNYEREKAIIKNNFIFLQKLENPNVNTAKNIVEKHKLNDEKSNYNQNVTSNKMYFEESVFMGDSITEGLDFYDIVNKSSVLAKKGQGLVQAKKSVSILSNISPERIFVLYGMNDLESSKNSDDFKSNYIKLVKDIKQTVPNAEIYLQSLTPVQAKVQQKNNSFSQDRLDKFTQAIIEVAREEHVHFIDIRPMLKGKEALFEQDGIHFKADFYGLWLNDLKRQLKSQSKT
ncbi:hypothetical protein KTC96_22980 (plasmid) [Clostridium estertheticum]|uniref:GDSL-type esterase/lipase family protein n=1 Tax=Clostridium estertheticum TaxID=238834 RepID=UPI001C7D9FA4|nr:GDSL-type esterase/lipase family protein [Clostridium estertheticum]MBX4260338.1 hypothetical protein [Clostridium estertheticum]WLC72772.1 hypothetical protein KTC96_22980 [Clostridium estertheticum]